MVQLRQLIFYLFALIYLIACPRVLFSAFGVEWAPGTDRGLERTGLLSIATIPSEASVFVDNRRYKDRTPMLLSGLQPGTYPVQVALKGYRAWARPLTIAAGQATVLERLLLLPQRGAFQTRVTAAYEALLPLPGAEAFLLVPPGAHLGDIVVYAGRRQQGRPLVASEAPAAGAVLRSYLTMPEGREMFCQVAAADGLRYLWVAPERGTDAVEDLTRLILSVPDEVHWAPRQNETLWILRGGTLDRLDRRQMTVSPIVAEGVRGLAVRGGTLYLVGRSPRLERFNENGEALAPLPEKYQPDWRLLAAARRIELLPLPDDLWLLRDDRGQVTLNRPEAGLLAAGVRGVAAHPSQPSAVIWNAQQVGILDATVPAHPEVRWLLAGRRHIERVFWSPEGDYLVIQEGAALSLMQLWQTPYVTVDHLLDVRPGTQAVWPQGAGSIYYLDPATRHLWSLELIPERYFSLLRFSRPGAR